MTHLSMGLFDQSLSCQLALRDHDFPFTVEPGAWPRAHCPVAPHANKCVERMRQLVTFFTDARMFHRG